MHQLSARRSFGLHIVLKRSTMWSFETTAPQNDGGQMRASEITRSNRQESCITPITLFCRSVWQAYHGNTQVKNNSQTRVASSGLAMRRNSALLGRLVHATRLSECKFRLVRSDRAIKPLFESKRETNASAAMQSCLDRSAGFETEASQRTSEGFGRAR